MGGLSLSSYTGGFLQTQRSMWYTVHHTDNDIYSKPTEIPGQWLWHSSSMLPLSLSLFMGWSLSWKRQVFFRLHRSTGKYYRSIGHKFKSGLGRHLHLTFFVCKQPYSPPWRKHIYVVFVKMSSKQQFRSFVFIILPNSNICVLICSFSLFPPPQPLPQLQYKR